jgi:alpha-L-fucosidase
LTTYPEHPEPALTAHEILAQHTTNVSAITAKVMSNAIVEYNNLRALVDDLARERTRELLRRHEPAEPEIKVSAALESVTEALATLADVIAKAKEFVRRAAEQNRLGVVPDAEAAQLLMHGRLREVVGRSTSDAGHVMTGADAYARQADSQAEPGKNGAPR